MLLLVQLNSRSSSSSSSANEYYLGGIFALLLQDHCTMSTKSVCSNQYMVTDQHWATGAHLKHSTLSDRIREWRPEQNSLQFLAEDGKRRRVPNVLHLLEQTSKLKTFLFDANSNISSNVTYIT